MSRLKKSVPRDYFKMHKRILKISGLFFTGNESIAYKIYSFIFLSTTIFAYTILDTYELFQHDFATSSGVLIYHTCAVMAVAKAMAILPNRKIIGKVVIKLEQEPFLPNLNRGGAQEEKIIRECIWKTNFQSYLYWIMSAGSVSVYTLYALSTRLRNKDYHKWTLSYGPLTILDITKSPYYEITWFYQSLCIFAITAVFTTVDLIIAAILAHISCQFKILQNFLRNIVQHSQKEMLKDHPLQLNNSIINKYLEKSIQEAVKYHLAIFELAKDMEESFRYMLLTTFVVLMGLLCLEIYQSTQYGIRYLIEYLTSSLQIITICYWGEEVLNQSQGVANAAYEADFVGYDINFQKALMMIIRRSQIPSKITAGKFVDICLATCLWVWRASYTLFMVLRNTK